MIKTNICGSQQMVRQVPEKRYLALDGWRGLCAIVVSAHHFHTSGTISSFPVVTHGYLFVDFFFLLSGFVIAHAYLGRLKGVLDVAQMMWRRIARLWPLHVVILAAFIALELVVPLAASISGLERSAVKSFDPQSGASLPAILTNLLFLHGLGIHDRLTWNVPSWSISVEFWTYLLFALLVVFFRRWLTVLTVSIALGGIVMIALMSPAFMAVENGLGFFRCLSGFFAGFLVYRLAKVPARPPMPSVLEASAFVGIVCFVSYAGGTVFELAAPLVFGVAVWLFAQEQGAISVALKCRPFQQLGIWSYSIYMVHSLVIAVVHRVLSAYEQVSQQILMRETEIDSVRQYTIAFGSTLDMDLVTLCFIGIVILVSAFTWRFIERPSTRYLNEQVFPKSRIRRTGLEAA